jgi:hypothetical protein
LYTQIIKAGKSYLYKNFSRIRREGPKEQYSFDEAVMSMEELKFFFDRLISTAPTDTGLLKKYLERQRSEFLRSGSKMTYEQFEGTAGNPAATLMDTMQNIKHRDKSGQASTPFIGVTGPGDFFTIEGPTRIERYNYNVLKGSTVSHSNMKSLYYSYAMDFVDDALINPAYNYRSTEHAKKWSPNASLKKLVESSFKNSADIIKNHYLIFFPQTRVRISKG